MNGALLRAYRSLVAVASSPTAWFRLKPELQTAGRASAPFSQSKIENRKSKIGHHSRWDLLLVGLAVAHGFFLILAPSIWLIALALWWNANTISHNFIHSPFFRSRAANAAFSAYLSFLLGFPQELWRARHLAHHQGKPWRARWSRELLVEEALVLILWSVLLALFPRSFFTVYLPGLVLGLSLCQIQGHYEHARGTVSHYGWLYNLIFFNDGYHVEHHARPAQHWTRLPNGRGSDAAVSRWPAILRWLEVVGQTHRDPAAGSARAVPVGHAPKTHTVRQACLGSMGGLQAEPLRAPMAGSFALFSLTALERLVLRSKLLQRFVLRNHERAFRKLLARLPTVRTVGIIGGGLFPRTALVLQRLLPDAKLTLIDACAENLQCARSFLKGPVECAHRFYDCQDDGLVANLDLLVVPLAFVGNRQEFYQRPPTPYVLVHDWLWHWRKAGTVISIALLKRLNLVHR